jgi:hypothetical protein
MSRYRHLIITLGVAALLLLTFGAAAAKPKDTPKPPHGNASRLPAAKGKPARLTWIPSRITQAVSAGQTIQITATFSSSVDIAEAMLVIPGALGKVLKADTAKLANIKAGVPTIITLTAAMPAKAHTQGGVVQLRAGQRMLAQPLPVLLTVAQGNAAGDDAPKPVKPTPTHP